MTGPHQGHLQVEGCQAGEPPGRPVPRLVHLHVEECSEELLRQQSYAIKNQRGGSKIPPNGGILRSEASSREFWMPELVLYGIRLLAKQLLGTVLDMEIENFVSRPGLRTVTLGELQ